MGEIDTKSIESVQAALSLFGEKCDHKKKFRSTSCFNVSQLAKSCTTASRNDMEKEKDIGSVLKYLSNLKIQLETKDSAHKQALLKLDHHENTVDELCTLLMSSELEKEIYMIECRGLRTHVHELESRIQKMDNQFLESVMIREQLSHAIGELKATQRELVAARDAKLEALTQVEVMENSLSMEKLKTDELLRNVSKLNETVLHLRMSVTEAEESTALLYEREAELELEAANAKEEVLFMRHQLEMMQDLEKVASDAVSEVKKLKEALELQERKNWDQSGYISLLESELRQLKEELNKANEEATHANADVETISIELEQSKKEMVEIRKKETEAQLEIAFLKSEPHKGRSKIAAAEIADSLAKSEKSALHLAVQQLALEAEEAQYENRRLKEADKASEESQNEESEERKGEAKSYITRTSKQVHEKTNEIQVLNKELKAATVKISELRTRTEQAISRAEAAEKGKAALENQIKRWKEHKERKKAALAALREESISREITEYKSDTSPKTLQPLDNKDKLEASSTRADMSIYISNKKVIQIEDEYRTK
ncbi:hypothetical protein RND71_029633 [Anisodus tanguticus]|uniref:Uncharacterized protein n=1 Tax=Anisodus tanguticus TaxID=243964 RepID=A0AAE1V7E6_9SOLA|nr:hypothetical protein RND71_029633 [Anisodus tanguticus]